MRIDADVQGSMVAVSTAAGSLFLNVNRRSSAAGLGGLAVAAVIRDRYGLAVNCY
jgi:hypothetical protein